MIIKCIITDDEPLTRQGLAKYVKNVSFLQLISMADSIDVLDHLLDQEPIDLVFLDINMPERSGIEYIKSKKNLPIIIFTTAYPEYAIDAFELDVLDYLVKPISFERFYAAAQKCRQYIDMLTSPQPINNPDYFFL